MWRRFRLRLFLVTFIRFLFVVIYFLGGSFFSVVIRRCRRFSWWIRKLLWRSFVDLARVFISVIVLVFLGFRFLLIFKVWYFVFKDIILCLDFIVIVKDIYLFFICCKYIFLFYVWVLFWKYVCYCMNVVGWVKKLVIYMSIKWVECCKIVLLMLCLGDFMVF